MKEKVLIRLKSQPPSLKNFWWKFLGFIIIWYFLSLALGWVGGLCLTIVLFVLFYEIYYQGIKKGEGKVMSWLEKNKHKELSDNYWEETKMPKV